MSLEKNIERIADALEALAKLRGTSPEKNDAAAPQQAAPYAPVQQPAQGNLPWQQAAPGGQPFQPQQLQGGPVPVSAPAGPGMPQQGARGGAAQPGQQPGAAFRQPAGPGTVPTTAAAQQYTFDQLAVATANLASSGRDVFTILGKFGVSMLMDLPPERFGEYAAALREAGAVI